MSKKATEASYPKKKQRKAKGKGTMRQAKIVFEGREGAKVAEESGAGKSRGYVFVETSSHRWALMGLRWLYGHAVESKDSGKKQTLIVEFAIENAQVVQRRRLGRGKQLKKGEVMKKTLVGMKGRPERPGFGKKGKVEDDGTKGKTFYKVDVATGKRKRDDDGAAEGGKKGKGKGEPVEKKFKPDFPLGEKGRLQNRKHVMQKKRMMRRKRKDGP